MNPWINYHHLFYFKTIAEENSVSKAAEKLRLGQPTLSAQLKQFEESLGVPLFERQHKKLVLTEQGKIALDYARNIFRMGSEMYEVLHDRIRPLRPTFHLGALDSIPKQVILQIVQHAYKVSDCQITLSEGKPDELLRLLSVHQMDLILSNFVPAGVSAKGLFPRSVSRKQVAFYGSPTFKKYRKDFPNSVSGQPLILPTFDSKLRQDIEHWGKLHKIELNIIAESQDIAIKKMMAMGGMGLIAAASHTVTGQILRGELIEVGPMSGVFEELFLISAQRKIANPIAAKLMESFAV